MNLNCETILDVYTFKRKKFLCLIKVNPKGQKLKNTCRCLSQEQWAIFDKKLEKLLTANNKLDDKSFKFRLNAFIEVKVQKSKLSFKHFYKLLDTIGDINKSDDVVDDTEQIQILECLIDFQKEGPTSSSVESQEYEPKQSNSTDLMMYSALPYEPYTPTIKKLPEYEIDIIKNNNINFLESNEETYFPKLLVDISLRDPNFATSVPQYTPAPIKDERRYKDNNKLNLLKDTAAEKESSVRKTSLKIKSSKKQKRKECEYIPKSKDVASLNVPIYIPTPIEEKTQQKLYDTNNIRNIRKRSNTIDVFSELEDENNKEKQMQVIEQQSHKGNAKYQSYRSFKKRSMTIDEIPAELSDTPIYIPTPLDEKTFQNVFKASEFGNSTERSSSKDIQFDENTKINQVFGKRLPTMIENNPTKINTKHDVMSSGKNSTPSINVMAAAPTQFNVLLKLEENDNVLTNAEESLPSKNELNRKLLKSLYNESIIRNPEVRPKAKIKESCIQSEEFHSVDKNNKAKQSHLLLNETDVTRNPEILPKAKIKESCIQSEEFHSVDKNNKAKQSHLLLNKTDVTLQKFLKRDNKIENYSTKAIKTFRRSERSPSKTKGLIEEQFNSSNKSHTKKHKPSLKNKELFGTDDEDYDDLFNKSNKKSSTLGETSGSKEINTPTSSKNKRRRDKSNDVEIEKKLREFIKDF